MKKMNLSGKALQEVIIYRNDYIFKKYEGDAFTNPELDTFLQEQDIECIEVIVNEAAIGTKFVKNKQFKRLRKLGAIWN